jgi:hypothetical protein
MLMRSLCCRYIFVFVWQCLLIKFRKCEPIFMKLSEASSTYSSVDVLMLTQYRTPVGSLENAVLCCAYALLWECCGIATNTCRLVLLGIGYRSSQHVGGFHGRLPHWYVYHVTCVHLNVIFCNPSHQPTCLYVSSTFATQRFSKTLTAVTNTY